MILKKIFLKINSKKECFQCIEVKRRFRVLCQLNVRKRTLNWSDKELKFIEEEKYPRNGGVRLSETIPTALINGGGSVLYHSPR